MNTETRVEISTDVMKQAQELARMAEILPGSVDGLALKIQEARNENRPLRVKLGVDPTASDLHLGHTVVLRRLRRFQDLGHQAVLILGDVTATIGDPTGRDSTRPELMAETAKHNARAFLKQITTVLDLSKTEVRHNSEWFTGMRLLEMLQVGKRIAQTRLSDRFAERTAGGNPPSWTETTYPLLQGWDSFEVRADIEIGGTDQLSNLLMGREIQSIKGMSPQVVMMLPLLEGTDGVKKMSKSFGNAIMLTDKPDDIFGKCMRLPDALILKFFELGTTLSADDLAKEAAFLSGGGNPRDAKERLATRVVRDLAGQTAADTALANWTRTHTERRAPDEMPSHVVHASTDIVAVIVDARLAPSKTAARKLIENGGVRLDGEKVTEPKLVIELTEGNSHVLSVGRRQFVKLIHS